MRIILHHLNPHEEDPFTRVIHQVTSYEDVPGNEGCTCENTELEYTENWWSWCFEHLTKRRWKFQTGFSNWDFVDAEQNRCHMLAWRDDSGGEDGFRMWLVLCKTYDFFTSMGIRCTLETSNFGPKEDSWERIGIVRLARKHAHWAILRLPKAHNPHGSWDAFIDKELNK